MCEVGLRGGGWEEGRGGGVKGAGRTWMAEMVLGGMGRNNIARKISKCPVIIFTARGAPLAQWVERWLTDLAVLSSSLLEAKSSQR